MVVFILGGVGLVYAIGVGLIAHTLNTYNYEEF